MTEAVTIDDYRFGRMTIGGKRYTSDLILQADGRVHAHWRRARGHRLAPSDIAEVLEAEPERLIIGTGAFGVMKVSDEVVQACRERGIALTACRTGEAVARYNEAVRAGRAVTACFHLTC